MVESFREGAHRRRKVVQGDVVAAIRAAGGSMKREAIHRAVNPYPTAKYNVHETNAWEKRGVRVDEAIRALVLVGAIERYAAGYYRIKETT